MIMTQAAAPSRLFDWMEDAVAGSLDAVAKVGQGRLLSVSFELPTSFLRSHWAQDAVMSWRGDRVWLAPSEGLALFGGGAVPKFEKVTAARLKSESATWVQLGDRTQPPLLFFTAAPAPQSGPLELCLPRVLLRRQGARASVTFSAFRDSTPSAAIARNWLTELRRMILPKPGIRGGGVENLAFAPGRIEWAARVRAATEAIGHGRFAKVVLARKAIVTLAAPINASDLAERLTAECPDCRIILLPQGGGQLVAASPELLAVKRGARIVSHALAGTAARSGGPEAEALAAARLFASPKERREHALVVEHIAGGLRELCDDVSHAAAPSLMRLPGLQHLWTPVSGVLRPGFSLLDVVERLHPTPAVLGSPRLAAKTWLAAEEEHRDGLYTGVAGWVDLNGDGEAAVVLRSAYIEGRRAHVWAGAGIMVESDPDSEWRETELKMATLLELLTGAAA